MSRSREYLIGFRSDVFVVSTRLTPIVIVASRVMRTYSAAETAGPVLLAGMGADAMDIGDGPSCATRQRARDVEWIPTDCPRTAMGQGDAPVAKAAGPSSPARGPRASLRPA